MFGIALFSGVSALAITSVLRYYLVPVWLSNWADRDILYTKDPEMKGVVVVTKRRAPPSASARGSEDEGDESFSGGEFRWAILASKKSHLNDPRKRWFIGEVPEWEVLANDEPRYRNEWEQNETFDNRWPLLRSIGGYWVGYPWLNQIYQYVFNWSEMTKDKDGKDCIRTRKEKTRYWFAQDFEYVIEFEDAKTKEGLPVRLTYLLTVRITNPHKALFETDDWLLRVTAVANRIAKNFAATYTYAELRGEGGNDAAGISKENLSKPIIDLTRKLPDEDEQDVAEYATGTKGLYGITIRAADLRTVILTGDAAKAHEETSILEYNAERQAAATVVTAEGTAKATRATGQADADVITMKGKAAATAADARLAAYTQQPELAMVMMNTDAQAAPGPHGKVIFTGPLGRLADTASDLLERVTGPSAANSGGGNSNTKGR